MKICLIISYDGTNYNGWQKQNVSNNGKRAIQNVVDDTLSYIYKEDIQTTGASRTDAGVHAMHQVAVFETNKNLPPEKISVILNQKLPNDIRIQKSFTCDENFHPRFMCKNKTYEYNIYIGEKFNPLYRNFVLHKKENFDIQLLNQSCEKLLGTHDFKGFSNISDVKNTIRTIYSCNFTINDEMLTFQICGDGFLYNMVRIVVATILDVGSRKKDISIIDEILKTGNRKLASATAKAYPLSLKYIKY